VASFHVVSFEICERTLLFEIIHRKFNVENTHCISSRWNSSSM